MKPDPIAFIAQEVFANWDRDLLNSWVEAARAQHVWREVEPFTPHHFANDTKIWDAEHGDWTIRLFDSSISDVPGQIPGSRHQVFSMMNKKEPLSLALDVPPFDILARLFYNEVRPGLATVPMSPEVLEQVALARAASMEEARRRRVGWLQNLIGSVRTNSAELLMPDDRNRVQIWKRQKRVKLLQGEMSSDQRIAFFALGYAVEEQGEEDEIVLCRLIAIAHGEGLIGWCRLWARLCGENSK
jgi:hypothetical protein